MAESLDVWHDRLPFSETLSGSLEGVCRFDSRSCQTLGVPRQSRGFTLGNYAFDDLTSQILILDLASGSTTPVGTFNQAAGVIQGAWPDQFLLGR